MANERKGFDWQDPFNNPLVNRYYFAFSSVRRAELDMQYGHAIGGEQLTELRENNRVCAELYMNRALGEGALGLAMLFGSRGREIKSKAAMIISGVVLIADAGVNLTNAIARAEVQEVLDKRDSVSRHDFEAMQWSKYP